MRVFHFVGPDYGLESIRRRRLKIATLMELNDPFELFGVDLRDERLRHAFKAMKSQLAERRGLLCFSRSWKNPVLWGHYAARHTGLALGFDVPDELLGAVQYSRKRLVLDVEKLRDPKDFDVELAKRFLFTKYSHWRYEDEVRVFASLNEKDPEKNLYFADFSDQLQLRQVVVAAESKITRSQLKEALGELASDVETIKARLAFGAFRVVRQRNLKLWA